MHEQTEPEMSIISISSWVTGTRMGSGRAWQMAGSAKTRGKRLDPMGYPTWIGGFRGFGEVGKVGEVGDVVVATVFWCFCFLLCCFSPFIPKTPKWNPTDPLRSHSHLARTPQIHEPFFGAIPRIPSLGALQSLVSRR
jgi:hypothetical protein